MTMKEELSGAVQKAMEIAGLEESDRVKISFEIFGGEVLFTIDARVPSKDKRKRDMDVRGMGQTLEEALEAFREDLVITRGLGPVSMLGGAR